MIARSTAHSNAETAKHKDYTIPFPKNERTPSHDAVPAYVRTKVVVDFVVASLLLLPLLLVMALVATAILLLEGRPIFYQQVRVGLRGKPFRIFKFRTMLPQAESLTGPVWSQANDTRVTPLGKWLRKTHLDEFPQIFNVLKGDMSFVGPRPERPEFVNRLREEIPSYDRRHNVRPGVTGLAQLTQGYDTCLTDVSSKTKADLEYIEQMGFFTDMTLFLKTIPSIFLPQRSTTLQAGKNSSTVSLLSLFPVPAEATSSFPFRIDTTEPAFQPARMAVGSWESSLEEMGRDRIPLRRAKTKVRRRITREGDSVLETAWQYHSNSTDPNRAGRSQVRLVEHTGPSVGL